MTLMVGGRRISVTRAESVPKQMQPIYDQIVAITFTNRAVTQTVRIDMGRGAEQNGENTFITDQGATLFGVKDHPTVDDTDVQHGDRFFVGNNEFEIISVAEYPGEIQAVCQVIS